VTVSRLIVLNQNPPSCRLTLCRFIALKHDTVVCRWMPFSCLCGIRTLRHVGDLISVFQEFNRNQIADGLMAAENGTVINDGQS